MPAAGSGKPVPAGDSRKDLVMSATSDAYTEADVREFFDETLKTYLSFWDGDGVLHTGYFASVDDADYRAAAERTSQVLAADAQIDDSSYVLDVGCGCGNFLMWLAASFGCRGEGLDLSSERIAFAQQRLAEKGGDQALEIAFPHGSATQMPLPDETFRRVSSPDALCQGPDKPRRHHEKYRALRPGCNLTPTILLHTRSNYGDAPRR